MQLHLAGPAGERRARVGIALEGVVCRRRWRGLAASAAIGPPTFSVCGSISGPLTLRCSARSCCCRRPRSRRTGPQRALWRQGLIRATRDRQRRGANQERQTSELRPATFWKASCSGAFQDSRRAFGNQRHPRPLAKIPLPIPDIGDLVEAKMTRENANRKNSIASATPSVLRSARSAERWRNLQNAKQPSAARPNLCSLSVLPPEPAK